ncbi:hypothetical protein AVEN_37570-1 [Araneus ventricosus]|uniref:Uncharacterized protein n=1 Tax=Araneus ventricosus TaxID=182803 RepID=A0A4Y2WNC3_ARAVE|nr:hypothetical protein AVEN_37570-1 [Araneus ventricosus]
MQKSGRRVKLDFHEENAPSNLEGFLPDRINFQPINFGGSFTGRTAPTANPSLTGNPVSKATAPPPHPAFQTDQPHPVFSD